VDYLQFRRWLGFDQYRGLHFMERYGRDGQFYNLSYSTWSAPTTFLPLASVAYIRLFS